MEMMADDNNGGNDNNGGSSNGGSHNNGSTSGSHSQSVQTGDNANVIMWAVLLVAAVAAVGAVVIIRRKKKIIKTESETRYTDSSYMGIRISYFQRKFKTV
ncbi:MAG: LPXTG cell wall anchor domain-containing protein [Mediterraneibacter gnavus]